MVIASVPARHFWDVHWWEEHWPELAFPDANGNPLTGMFDYVLAHVGHQPVLKFDDRPAARHNNAWWAGDAGQVAWFIWGCESLWMPESLLEENAQQRLAEALFAGSRYSAVSLHFNKGLAGAPPDAIARAKDTATNPAVLTAFALAIAANAQGPALPPFSGHTPGIAYPGILGHELSVVEARKAVARIDRCMSHLRALVQEPGSYVSESNYFEKEFQQSYWGGNYARLVEVKRKYDPDGLFFVHDGVSSEQWSPDGFTKL